MPQEEIFIATVEAIADPDSKGLSIDLEDTKLELFIIKKDSQISIYKNSCPHTYGPLDWSPD
jgi:nitrite reductase/ring-hydroxylating ferredoxin subunit